MPEQLKNLFFTQKSVSHLANCISENYKGFDKNKFINEVFDKDFEKKELKERMRHVAKTLKNNLPDDYKDAVKILMEIAPHITGFDAMCLPDFVELYGLEHWDLSFEALEVFTKSCSSEFAVRPFIAKDPDKAMKIMYVFAESDNHHVRRLASEGCRPMLPWAMALPEFKKDPHKILPILEKLKDDESEYVRKSVANNLNDISKNHPELVLDICEKWQGNSNKTDWIIKQACRTMLKTGNKRAMVLFGFANPKNILVKNLKVDNHKPSIGDTVTFSFDLEVKSKTEKKVRLEYIVHFVKKNKKTSPKVFQLKEVTFNPGVYSVEKKQSFKDVSTRTHLPGKHLIEIKVNGEVKDSVVVELK